MIIATGTLNIDENAKLAQLASEDAKNAADSASDLAEKMKNTVATMDGKTTVSTSTPFDDGKEHNEGDMWTVINDDVASAMYIYSGGSWQVKKWDQEALSVNQLSALTADLGHVTAGWIESAIITGAQITENSANGTITLDNNGFSAASGSSYFKFVASGSNQYTVAHGGIRTDDITANTGNIGDTYIEGQTFAAYNANTHIGQQGTWTWLSENIKCGSTDGGNPSISPTSGTAIYFHNEAGSTIDIHAGDVISHGHTLTSTLSSKRSISDISTTAALAKVNATDIKRWQYKDDDNSKIHIGPIIDDVNKLGDKQYNTPNDLITQVGDETGLNESNALSMTMAALQELSKRNDQLSQRVTEIERKVNNAK